MQKFSIKPLIWGFLFIGFFAILPFKTFATTFEVSTFQRGYTMTSGNATLGVLPQAHEKAVIDFKYSDGIATVKIDPTSTFLATIVLPKSDYTYGAIYYRPDSSKPWERLTTYSGVTTARHTGSLRKGQYKFKVIRNFLYNDDKTSVRLSAEAVKLGYTIKLGDLLMLGIQPDSVQKDVILTLVGKHIDVANPPGMTRISPMYVYDIYHPDVVKLTKPVWLNVKYFSDSSVEKVLMFYDRINKVWRPFPTTVDIENKRVHAAVWLPYANIAVFENPNHMQIGKGSWYGADHMGVASNDYPRGTLLRVTNLGNGKSVVVPVVSTGPFVPGRIADLTKPAFEQIANPSTGVIMVKVEHVF